MGLRQGALESLAVTAGFWRGRRVLVTGHTGFKGAWLCWWLAHLGAKVAGFALAPPTSPSLFEASGLAAAIDSVRGDVRDGPALERAFGVHRPEIVFHLAAQSLVRRSYREPIETFATNVLGTVQCLESARRCDAVRAVVLATTDKCYRNRGDGRAYRESDELGGDDPYSASKACAELAAHAYRRSFLDTGRALAATVRAGNVIGGGDWAEDRLVPDALRAFAAGRPLEVRNPDAVRPWQHVLDPLRGYLALAERLHAGERPAATAWNFGPDEGDARPVSWLVDQLADRLGAKAAWRHDAGEHPHEAAELALDSGKARAGLGWRPRLPIAEALDWVVDWHKAASAPGSARAATLDQIARYEACAAR